MAVSRHPPSAPQLGPQVLAVAVPLAGGPASGTDRVMRGGGWTSTPDGLRASTRQAVAPTTWMSNLGFRVAKSP